MSRMERIYDAPITAPVDSHPPHAVVVEMVKIIYLFLQGEPSEELKVRARAAIRQGMSHIYNLSMAQEAAILRIAYPDHKIATSWRYEAGWKPITITLDSLRRRGLLDELDGLTPIGRAVAEDLKAART